LELAERQLTIFVFVCKTDKSKPVKQEVNSTMIFFPLVSPGQIDNVRPRKIGQSSTLTFGENNCRVSVPRPSLELPGLAHDEYGDDSVPLGVRQFGRVVDHSIGDRQAALLSTLDEEFVVSFRSGHHRAFVLVGNEPSNNFQFYFELAEVPGVARDQM
jgi:hypothetical protein